MCQVSHHNVSGYSKEFTTINGDDHTCEKILLQQMQLGEPFELGTTGTFTAPADGDLYVRCQDDWSRLSDNSGSLVLRLRAHTPDEPLVGVAE